MAATAEASNTAGKGFIYFTGLFLLGLIGNIVGLYVGSQLGVLLNKTLMFLGVSFGEYNWMFLPFLLAVVFWAGALALVVGGSVRRIGRFMGGHMLVTAMLAFATIIGANLSLAYSAVKTFPGLEVKNSYVASQEFNTRKAEQVALGWKVDAEHQDGVLRLSIVDAAGKPVQPAKMQAILGRPTQVKDDQELSFTFDGAAFVTPVTITDGNWNIRMTAVSEDGSAFQKRIILHVK